MLVYTIVLFAFCIALVPLHVMGRSFLAAALIVGGWFLFDAIRVLRNEAQSFARAHVQVFAGLSRADVPRRRH